MIFALLTRAKPESAEVAIEKVMSAYGKKFEAAAHDALSMLALEWWEQKDQPKPARRKRAEPTLRKKARKRREGSKRTRARAAGLTPKEGPQRQGKPKSSQLLELMSIVGYTPTAADLRKLLLAVKRLGGANKAVKILKSVEASLE
jgi:hypothetical protein